MVVNMPQELEVWYIIPAIRKELALTLKKKGLTQKEIAKKLYITEPAVSQYMKNKRAKQVVFREETKQKIKEAAENILKNPSKVNLIKQTQNICREARKNMVLCELHKKLDETIECGGCDCYENILG
ncbi:MAG: helix-turn-helix domain-containing protein [Nanoarchaeota archaeon]|nr:helix-turn-helix domain-containing protein [Nanoarchaeota archaeon]